MEPGGRCDSIDCQGNPRDLGGSCDYFPFNFVCCGITETTGIRPTDITFELGREDWARDYIKVIEVEQVAWKHFLDIAEKSTVQDFLDKTDRIITQSDLKAKWKAGILKGPESADFLGFVEPDSTTRELHELYNLRETRLELIRLIE